MEKRAGGMRAGIGLRLVVAALILVAGSALAGGVLSASGRAGSNATGGQLNLRGELRLVSRLSTCPGPGSTETCASRTGQGVISGLGRVSVAYTWRIDLGPPSCTGDLARTLAYGVVLVVAGKGEIRTSLGEAPCVDIDAVRSQAQTFTVIGGTGIYAEASGGGTVDRSLGQTGGGAAGTETWSGTLDVPGLEFDVTRPTISLPSRRIFLASARARRTRVTYVPRARDEVDGAVPVSCKPGSGTRFPVGRTTVTCSAADTSGNARTSKFVITVKPRR